MKPWVQEHIVNTIYEHVTELNAALQALHPAAATGLVVPYRALSIAACLLQFVVLDKELPQTPPKPGKEGPTFLKVRKWSQLRSVLKKFLYRTTKLIPPEEDTELVPGDDVEEEEEWRIRTSLLAGARCTGPLPQSLRGRGPFLEPMRRT